MEKKKWCKYCKSRKWDGWCPKKKQYVPKKQTVDGTNIADTCEGFREKQEVKK